MKRAKAHFFQRILAYVLAASVFTIITELLMQALSLVFRRQFMPITDEHIACLTFTFWFLVLLGFALVALGHMILSLLRAQFASVIKRHAFAYAIGYMCALCFGIACSIYANPSIAQTMINAWWSFLISASLLFAVAFISGLAFGRIYETRPS